MKALLFAALATLVYLGMVTAIFRSQNVRQRAALMVRLWLVSVPALVVAYLATPADLGVLPADWTDQPAWAGLCFLVLAYAAAFFGGVLQLYNLAERGFSLRILMDVDESPRGAMTAAEIMRDYGRGQGFGWMYQKRLDDLQAQGLGVIDGGTLRATERGRRMARTFQWLRNFLRLDAES
jgi:hypothetical protein